MDLTEDEPLRFETTIEAGAPIVGNAPSRGVAILRSVYGRIGEKCIPR